MPRAGTASHTPHTSNPEEGIIGAVPSSSKIHVTERGCKGLASSSCALGDHGHSSGSANGGSSGSPEEECMPDESGIGFMSSDIQRRRKQFLQCGLCGPPATLSLLNGISSCHIWTSLHACMPDDIYPCLYDRTWYELISVFFWPTSAPTLKGPPSLTPERARHTSYPNKMKFKLLSLGSVHGSVEVGHVVGLRSATKPNSRDAGIMPVYVQ